nr:hypothetical protein [Dendronalium sp. ChiSLP03b]
MSSSLNRRSWSIISNLYHLIHERRRSPPQASLFLTNRQGAENAEEEGERSLGEFWKKPCIPLLD